MISIVFSLLVAWILDLFNFSNIIIVGIKELFGKTVSITTYYFIFAIFGLIKSLITQITVNVGRKER